MKIDKRMKKIVDSCSRESFSNGEIMEKKVKRFVKAFSSLPRSFAIVALSRYLRGIKREMNKTTLIVETEQELENDQRQQILSTLKASFSILNSEFRVNSSLLGGIRIKIGDVRFDDSISRKIENVKGAIIG